jgi:hypothetical protein
MARKPQSVVRRLEPIDSRWLLKLTVPSRPSRPRVHIYADRSSCNTDRTYEVCSLLVLLHLSTQPFYQFAHPLLFSLAISYTYILLHMEVRLIPFTNTDTTPLMLTNSTQYGYSAVHGSADVGLSGPRVVQPVISHISYFISRMLHSPPCFSSHIISREATNATGTYTSRHRICRSVLPCPILLPFPLSLALQLPALQASEVSK